MPAKNNAALARKTVDDLYADYWKPGKNEPTLFIVTSGDGSSIKNKRAAKLTKRQQTAYGRRLETLSELLMSEVGADAMDGDEAIAEARLEHLADEIRTAVPECLCTFKESEAVAAVARAFDFGDTGIELLFGRRGVWWFLGMRT
ncbi:MAG: hypothetical protein AB7O26_14790 [Planctomycetaceae bacterium]